MKSRLVLIFYNPSISIFCTVNSQFSWQTFVWEISREVQRINFRKGRVSAISATARKLAVIIWNMVVKGVQYINPEGYLFLDQKRKLGMVKRIQKQIAKFDLTADDLGIVST